MPPSTDSIKINGQTHSNTSQVRGKSKQTSDSKRNNSKQIIHGMMELLSQNDQQDKNNSRCNETAEGNY